MGGLQKVRYAARPFCSKCSLRVETVCMLNAVRLEAIAFNPASLPIDASV